MSRFKLTETVVNSFGERLWALWVCNRETSCAEDRHSAPTQACKSAISSYLFASWHLFRHVGYLRHQQQVDLWPFDLEIGVWVTCDV